MPEADPHSLLQEYGRARWEVITAGDGPPGRLPLTEQMLVQWPSGHLFGMTQAAAMGWPAEELDREHVLILSTCGGLRDAAGRPVALGYHTGHWEVELLVRAAADQLRQLGRIPFAAFVSDPCDGRTQGTPGMFDSLAYRNDAALVLRRLIRSLPTCRAVIGVATCDKGLPAMMMALAAQPNLPAVLVPGGVMLPSRRARGENTATIQAIGARFAHGQVTLEHAAEAGCAVCGSAGGGCQFMGTAATSQVVAEALGLALPHSALAPSGQPIWLDLARQSARAVLALQQRGISAKQVVTADSLHNAMAVFAAVGGSTNMLLHLPAIAHAAGLRRPSVHDWRRINGQVPRLVDVLPNGPVNHPTLRVFLAGGVPEVMLQLRELGLLRLEAVTALGLPLAEVLRWWERSARRAYLRRLLREREGVDPDEVIMSPAAARGRGLTSTITFCHGNLAPDGAVTKSTAIDPSLIGPDGLYRHTGPARVFRLERDAIAAIKQGRIRPGDVIVLICRGPLGAGMEEIFQITAALRYLEFGRHVAVVTDARFSGVSTGACIGHIGPEALAGGPIGKVQEGDLIQIEINCRELVGSVDFVGRPDRPLSPEQGGQVLARRRPAANLGPDPDLPDDTRLWALLQSLSGGTWAGCVYDPQALERLVRQRHSTS